MRKIFTLLFIYILIVPVLTAGEQVVEHNLQVALDPIQHTLSVRDSIRFPGEWAGRKIHFLLHQNLSPEVRTDGFKLIRETGKTDNLDFGMPAEKFKLPEIIEVEHFSLDLPSSRGKEITCVFDYSGEIHHPIEQLAEDYARGFSETPGIIAENGIYLAGSSYWIPWFNSDLITFNLTVKLTAEWDVVSQGKRSIHEIKNTQRVVRWESPELMEEVYLIAAPFTEYQREHDGVLALVFLRSPDEAMARKYLETTAQYLEMYNTLIGPYPYSKFALVENFWETGYGMPSFTLLGQKIIRFPFILHSSYPHELLHNWWGNGVFVDYESGNWCEGLTVFFADHLIKEQRGQGVEYRRTALQAFTDYVHTNNDFPLTQFTSRHDASSSAIGYNKSMMVFNMLRQEIGDDSFLKSIQLFYNQNKFKKAGFRDLQKSFESVTGKNYDSFFSQWLTRTGAPLLEINQAESKQTADGYELSFTLLQEQPDDAFQLDIPLAIHLEGTKSAVMQKVQMNSKKQDYQLTFKNRPLIIDVDPQFDLFRILHRDEVPPALSQAFGSEKVLIVIPGSDSPQLKESYRTLAGEWSKDKSSEFTVSEDIKITEIPADESVWILGKNNRLRNQVVNELKNYSTELKGDSVYIGNVKTSLMDHSLILTVRNPNNADKVLVWVSAHTSQAVSGLGRKLPHYGKYSYLGFEGDEPTNVIQGQWPTSNTPMRAYAKQVDEVKPVIREGSLPRRQALGELKPLFSAPRMKADIEYLASDSLQGRGLGSAGLELAATYIANQFKKAGLMPGGEKGSYYQEWQEIGGPENKSVNMKNVIGILPGNKKEWDTQSVVVCAHYDHLGLGWPDVRQGNEGKIHYGADDNASGVAVLLEMARSLGTSFNPDRTIIFFAATGEESGLRGSRYYIQNMKKYPVQKIIGMLNLDTVGRLNEKILVLNSNTASEWKHIVMGVGFVTGISYELVSQELEASDQVSFISAGVPAIQLFSGAHPDYHRPDDTPEKINMTGLVKVATFTKEIADYLSSREEGLTWTGKTPSAGSSAPAAAGRKVSTGIMPDFSFSGEGVKIGQVAPDSPAARAGMKVGDIIIQFASTRLKNLKEYSEILKQHNPGDEVEVVYLSEGKETKTKIRLEAR